MGLCNNATFLKNYFLNLQKYTDAPFNSIEDCGVDSKFVNVVYDTLPSAVSKIVECFLYCKKFSLFNKGTTVLYY